LVCLFPFSGAEKIDDRPGDQDGAGDLVEQGVLLHLRISGQPAVIKAPQPKGGEDDRKEIGADLRRWGEFFFGQGSTLYTAAGLIEVDQAAENQGFNIFFENDIFLIERRTVDKAEGPVLPSEGFKKGVLDLAKKDFVDLTSFYIAVFDRYCSQFLPWRGGFLAGEADFQLFDCNKPARQQGLAEFLPVPGEKTVIELASGKDEIGGILFTAQDKLAGKGAQADQLKEVGYGEQADIPMERVWFFHG
jgi:hypothetical protein